MTLPMINGSRGYGICRPIHASGGSIEERFLYLGVMDWFEQVSSGEKYDLGPNDGTDWGWIYLKH